MQNSQQPLIRPSNLNYSQPYQYNMPAQSNSYQPPAQDMGMNMGYSSYQPPTRDYSLGKRMSVAVAPDVPDSLPQQN